MFLPQCFYTHRLDFLSKNQQRARAAEVCEAVSNIVVYGENELHI